jgi:recombination protein RecA
MSLDEKAMKARDAALSGALQQIERQFGKGSVMRMGDEGAQVKVNAIPTGALALDLALGIGGMPRGRIVEVFGPEASGKTTLVYHVLAEAQKLGGVCAFIDAEHAMDPLYARQIGVDIDELLVSQPDYGEQALEIADMLVRSGAVDVVAIDSVAALTPRAELEGQMGDQTVGLQARMMSQAMRKLAGNLNRTQTLCLFTNQIREKVGVMFGSPETQPGGRALKFYSSQRLDIRRIETLKEGTEAVGNKVRVKVVKNKVAAPFRQAEFDIEFGKGFSTSGCLIDLGIEHNIVTKSGSFFSYGDERLGQGRNNAKAFLDEHQEIAKEIENKIYAVLAVDRDLVAPIERDEDVAPEMPDVEAEASAAAEAAAAALPTCPLTRVRASSTPWTSRIGTSAAVIARWPRSAGTSRPSRWSRRPPTPRWPSCTSRATSTTRASRSASPRTAVHWMRGVPSESSASCAMWGWRPSTSRRRCRLSPPTTSATLRSRCCAAA